MIKQFIQAVLKSLMVFLVLGLISTYATAEKLNQKLAATQVIDLTQPMYDGMPYWPGGVPFKKERLVDYDQGYQLHQFTMGENTGTHVDAPSHFVKGQHTIDQIPLNQLVLPIAVIDVQRQARANADYQLTVEEVKKWEKKNGQIPSGSLVVLNTGWHKKFKDPKSYVNLDENNVMHFPGFSADSAKLLIKRNVTGIGIDTLSLDYGMSQDFATHLLMLQANKYQIENMANLDALPETGATAVIGVLPIKEGSQAQARILAFLP